MKYTYLFAKKMSGKQGKDFTIDCNGYFKSARKAERITLEVKGEYLPKEHPGDTLLSVYSTAPHSTVCIVVEFGPGLTYTSINQAYKFFKGAGLPLTGQYTGPVKVVANASVAQVYAVYEKYDALDRELLASYRAPYDVSYGVKLRDGHHTYQVKDGALVLES
jgi:hypothetical protein